MGGSHIYVTSNGILHKANERGMYVDTLSENSANFLIF